jgi:hypothetical protein
MRLLLYMDHLTRFVQSNPMMHRAPTPTPDSDPTEEDEPVPAPGMPDPDELPVPDHNPS